MSKTLDRLPLELVQHRILNTAQSAEFCGFSVPHFRRLYRAGIAPAPRQLSSRKLGWRLADLIDWVANCKGGR
jgi:predicted DNA-binding transcriptional regulator AlpA